MPSHEVLDPRAARLVGPMFLLGLLSLVATMGSGRAHALAGGVLLTHSYDEGRDQLSEPTS